MKQSLLFCASSTKLATPSSSGTSVPISFIEPASLKFDSFRSVRKLLNKGQASESSHVLEKYLWSLFCDQGLDDEVI